MPVITLEDGISIRTFSPPPGFDPLVATASELEQYGFPVRPNHPSLLKLYQRVFARLKGRLNYIEPAFRVIRDKSHGPPPSAGVYTGDNWSGGVVQPPLGKSFNQVMGEWVVPNAYPKPGEVFLNSYWIGLDGFIGPPWVKSSRPASTASCSGPRAASTSGTNGPHPPRWRSATRQSAPAIWWR